MDYSDSFDVPVIVELQEGIVTSATYPDGTEVPEAELEYINLKYCGVITSTLETV